MQCYNNSSGGKVIVCNVICHNNSSGGKVIVCNVMITVQGVKWPYAMS